MIINAVIGNIHEGFDLAGRHQETIYLPSTDLLKRIQRVRTDHGTELGIQLARGAASLQDGDVLHASDDNCIVVAVASSDVIVIRPDTPKSMLFVAHSLGNRHLPAQFFDEHSDFGDFTQAVMVVAFDHTVVEFLEHHNVPYERTELTMPEPFRHAEHTH